MQYDALLDDVRGLESGRVEAADLRRLLVRTDRSIRPDVAGVLRAAGAIVFLFGLALVFGVGYDGYPHVVKLVGPFAFPALTLAAAIWLHRRRRPRWEVELAGMVGYVALGLAFETAGVAANAGSGYGLAASATAIAVVVAMHAAVRIVRLTSWGLSASLVAFTAFASDLGGFLDGGTAPWLLTAQFAVRPGRRHRARPPKPRGRGQRASLRRAARTARVLVRHRGHGPRVLRPLAPCPHVRRRGDARGRRRIRPAGADVDRSAGRRGLDRGDLGGRRPERGLGPRRHAWRGRTGRIGDPRGPSPPHRGRHPRTAIVAP